MKFRRDMFFLLAPLTLVAAVGASLWQVRRPASEAAVNQSNVVQVKRDKLTRLLLVSGELAAVRAVRIAVPRFRERGAVPIQAMAPEGAQVKPGDVLLQIDNANLSTSLSNEQINLEKAENDLIKKQAEEDARLKELEVELANRKLEVEKTALKAEISRDLISLRDWQDNQFNHQKAKKEFEKVEQSLELARKAAAEDIALLRVKREQIQARIKAINDDLTALQIRATAPGTVLYENAPLTWNSGDNPRKFQVGDQVSPGMFIMSVPDLSEMEVRVFISEVDGGLVQRGMRARLTSDSVAGHEFWGTLDFVPEVAERLRRLSNVRVFVGKVKLDQTDANVMKPGMSVKVEIILEEQTGLTLPRRAVFEEAGKFYVRHATRGKLEVKVVARNAVACLIEGLSEGEMVEVG